MQLPMPEVKQFYELWYPLMVHVNRRLNITPQLKDRRRESGLMWNATEVVPTRDAFWADPSLLDDYISLNQNKLREAQLRILRSWRHRVKANFIIMRHLRKHSLFLDVKSVTIYGVLGLVSKISEVTPFTPCTSSAVLLPWKDRIIYDSMLASSTVGFTADIIPILRDQYNAAKERGAIVTSLPAG